VQQDAPSHVCEGDAHHDDESAHHEALAPCFEDEFIRTGGFGHQALVEVDGGVVQRDWSHDA
jgi:hypothetical protein